ncbi:hypothetical protein POL68_37435 [Stigmatella sp. ncwal1]|uniref:Large ATP-binding protein n=1 Tax=Stigmatella ashevillensis TaxID=2995309 RepID=A0ABT5DKL2_9BACT|nr:hypothetical protein [Stigmatella ashevillena]MDC0714207.1 hypothetical protein [Stigmatella ashevillena]
MRRWLSQVSISFGFGGQNYQIEFETGVRHFSGALYSVDRQLHRSVRDRFSSEPGFAAVMAGFMMQMLDLDPIPSHQSAGADDGQSVEHGWPALAGALYFGGDHKLLLGDVKWGGLPARMLQMYVGMPWARTVMQATTAHKEAVLEEQRSTRARGHSTAFDVTTRERIERELNAARQVLATIPEESASAERLDTLASEVARLSGVHSEVNDRLAQAEAEALQLRALADADERAARSLRENALASAFFNGLNPSCCPRCETAIDADRRKLESSGGCCSLCAEPVNAGAASEDLPAVVEESEGRREATALAAAEAEARILTIVAERDSISSKLGEARKQLGAQLANGGFRRRREAELAVARLEGALNERATEPPVPVPSKDRILLDAALEEAKREFEAARGDLLTSLNQEILRLGRAFGIRSLESVNLNSAAQMRLRKGNQDTAFSHLSPGERLRLRIATVISLLRVGREHKVGRHPGLVFIDSPGAEETNEQDLASLLRELCSVAKELPELQILIASANAAAVKAVLGPDQYRIASAGHYLW